MSAIRPAAAAGPKGWLFSRRVDLWAFGGSALASLLLLAFGTALGIEGDDAPPWVFLLCVIAIDVAHVWSTLFRVYLDSEVLWRRPLRYFGLPVLCYLLGALVHFQSPALFWRCLAYTAVFHFVRQQLGFLKLYQAKQPHPLPQWEIRLEQATMLCAMVYPLLYWHTHLPQPFAWMMEGDFLTGLPAQLADLAAPIYYGLLLVYGLHTVLGFCRGAILGGRPVLIATTAMCWYLGIVAFPGDFAFTVTNVIIHGVPYIVLTYRYGQLRASRGASTGLRPLSAPQTGLAYFVGLIWTAALVEEWLWHRLVFQDQAALFGSVLPGDIQGPWWTPLLAVPQLTHYALDGLVWRRQGNPELTGLLGHQSG